MLQQTQVDTVLPYYVRFLERFPTVETLATSSEEDALRLWSGLGYYNRIRNFQRAARQVVDEHNGRIPDTYDDLIKLPGIGRYMAGAILSIAFNQAHAIVDGNVRRVLARVNGWKAPKDSALWSAAETMVQSGEPRVVNQAMMELGATLCSVKTPRCRECPWQLDCVAFETRSQNETPVPRKRPRTVRVDLYAVLDLNKNGFLMRKVEGLWEFPILSEPPSGQFERIGSCRHAVTHHRIEIEVYTGKLGRRAGYRRVQFDELPVSSMTQKIRGVLEL